MEELIMTNNQALEAEAVENDKFEALIDDTIEEAEKKADAKNYNGTILGAAIGAGVTAIGFGIPMGIKGIKELKRLKAKQKAYKEAGIDMSIKAIRQEEAGLIKEIKYAHETNATKGDL